ncbi:hypothetical protein FGADI_3076, partial [Fusarium gaditjirri]
MRHRVSPPLKEVTRPTPLFNAEASHVGQLIIPGAPPSITRFSPTSPSPLSLPPSLPQPGSILHTLPQTRVLPLTGTWPASSEKAIIPSQASHQMDHPQAGASDQERATSSSSTATPRKFSIRSNFGKARQPRSRKNRPCDACRRRKTACVITSEPP